MELLKVGPLSGALTRIAVFRQIVGDNKFYRAPLAEHNDLLGAIGVMREHATTLDLPAAIAAADRVLVIMARARAIGNNPPAVGLTDVDAALLGTALGSLTVSFRDDASGRSALILPAPMVGYYEQPRPLFGADVASKFSSDAAWEIEEAGKCLALGRDTACVFHLMRTMEVALEAIRICLQLPAPLKPQDKNWGTILSNYKKETDARNNPQHPRQWQSQQDAEFFTSLYASLVAVKDAWRNKTMHVEKTYTPDQAKHVFAVVKGFMETAAGRLDESGHPSA